MTLRASASQSGQVSAPRDPVSEDGTRERTDVPPTLIS